MSIRTGEHPVRVRAPGKINLALRVGPAGADGYHRLVTVFQAVSLYEDVRAAPSAGFSLSVSGRQADAVPTDGRNLALRAAHLLADAARVRTGVHLHLVKGVPTAGGMGGGSADAAAALLACDLLWGTGLARDELAELASELGADVPFALTGLTAVGRGRGDVLSPALARGQYSWVLALQAGGLSTPEVFARFDALHATPPSEPAMSDALMAALLVRDPAALAPHLVNDLQLAALDLAPHLADVLDAAAGAGALAQIVSGSGPTVVALASSSAHAHSIAEHLRASDVASEVLTVTGPVPGARLLESVRAPGPPVVGA